MFNSETASIGLIVVIVVKNTWSDVNGTTMVGGGCDENPRIGCW